MIDVPKLGEVTTDCGLCTHLLLTGESNEEPPLRLSDIDSDWSCSGLPVPSILLVVEDVDARVGVRGPPILERTLLSYAWDESLRFCLSKDRSP